MYADILLPTNGWDCGDYFPQFELVEDCCFSCSIEPHHQDPHLLLSYEALQQISKNVPHDSDDELQCATTIVMLFAFLQCLSCGGRLEGNRTNNHLVLLLGMLLYCKEIIK